MEVVPVLLPLIDAISSVRVYIPKDLRLADSRNAVGKTLKQVNKQFPDGVPLLDPIEDMHIEDEEFKKLIKVRVSLSRLHTGFLLINFSLSLENRGARGPTQLQRCVQGPFARGALCSLHP